MNKKIFKAIDFFCGGGAPGCFLCVGGVWKSKLSEPPMHKKRQTFVWRLCCLNGFVVTREGFKPTTF